MPHYDYECEKCGHTFEAFQRITEPLLRDCPRCHGSLRRLIGSGASLIFKGSGFYKTDYRSDSYKKKAEAERPKPPEKPKPKEPPKSEKSK